MIEKSIKVSRFDSKHWVINSEDRNVLINNSAHELLKLLATSRDMDEAFMQFSTKFSNRISIVEFHDLVKKKFGGYSILQGDTIENKVHQTRFFKFKKELLTAEFAGMLSEPLKQLFAPKLFFWLLVMLFGVLINLVFFSSTYLCQHRNGNSDSTIISNIIF